MIAHDGTSSAKIASIRPMSHTQDVRDDNLGWALRGLGDEAGEAYVLLVDDADPDAPRLMANAGITRDAAAELARHVGRLHAGGDAAARPALWVSGQGAGSDRLLHMRAEGRSSVSAIFGFPAALTPAAADLIEKRARLMVAGMTRCVTLDAMAQAERRRGDALRAVLDRSRAGIVLLDADRRVRLVNASASALLAARDGIKPSGESISATAVADAVRLRVAIDHVTATDQGDAARDGPVIMLSLSRNRSVRPLTVAIAGVPHPMAERGDIAVVLHLLRDDEDITTALGPLCRLHGLSPVETRLTCHIVAGKSLLEAATLMCVKHQTVRGYLRQIFYKTGTNRQAELVRLMVMTMLPGHGDAVEALIAVA